MTPLVSVIIPCFNAGSWIDEAIRSVLNQTHEHLELVVVDDGSSDDTCDRVSAHVRLDARVRLVRQPNAGPSTARNLGVRSTSGVYVQFLDADDLLAPQKIATQVARLESLPRDWVAIGPFGSFVESVHDAEIIREAVWADHAPADWIVVSWNGGGFLPVQTYLLPRSLIERAGPWLETLRVGPEDAEYFTRTILASAGVAFCEDAMSFVRRRPSSRSADISDRAMRAELDAFTMMADHLLRVENTARTRRAAAMLLQRFAYVRYPRVPVLVAEAESRAAALGGADLEPLGGRGFGLLASAIGWKAARWLAHHSRPLRRRGR